MKRKILSLVLAITCLFTIGFKSSTVNAAEYSQSAVTIGANKTKTTYSSLITAVQSSSETAVDKTISALDSKVTTSKNSTSSQFEITAAGWGRVDQGKNSKNCTATNNSFSFEAKTSIPAKEVTFKIDNDSNVHNMTSSDRENWTLDGIYLADGNRTVTITATSYADQTVTKTLNIAKEGIMALAVSANKASGTTDDSFSFDATTNIPAKKVTLKIDNDSNTYSMKSSLKNSYGKKWTLVGKYLAAGNRTVTITATSNAGQTVTATLSITVTEPKLTLLISANKSSGTTDDSFSFGATTNIPAKKVTLKINNDRNVYNMSSSDGENWTLDGIYLAAGNRTVTITAISNAGQTVTKTLNITVTEPKKDITVAYKYYNDVPDSHWAHKYICAANYYGLMQGVANNEFDPDEPIKYAHFISVLNKIHYVGSNSNYNSITRNEAIIRLWQAAGSPTAPTSLLNNMSDASSLTDTNSKYAWSWCIQKGIVNGDSGKLMPYNNLTRAEAAKLFVLYYCLEVKSFRLNNIYLA